jgi:hypothetical protein
MLLSDPLGGQLAGFAFLLAGALLVYGFSRRLGGGRVLSAFAAALLLLLYVHSPGVGAIADNGGWGQLQKNHITTGVLIFAVCWLQFEMMVAPLAERRRWLIVSVLTVIGLGIASAQSLFLIGIFCVILLSVLVLGRNWDLARRTFLVGFASGLSIAAVFTLNYLVTGLPSDQYVTEFWPIVNLDWLQRWDLLLNVVLLHQAHDALARTAANRDVAALLSMLNSAFFLYLLVPIIIAGALSLLVAAGVRSGDHRAARQTWTGLGVLAALLLATLAVALLAGAEQNVSFPRYAEFVPPALLTFGFGAMALAGLAFSERGHPKGSQTLRLVFGRGLPLVAVVVCAFLTLSLDRWRADIATVNGWRFATGQMSIYDAFRRQDGEVGSFQWGAIHPGAEGAWSILAPGEKVWSFHVHTYCQLPHCAIESFFSMRSGLAFEDLYFGGPEAARSALQRAGMNHFLFVDDLTISTDLSAVSLFRPETIGDYLGIKWTNGSSYLLTWLGPDVAPLSGDWIARYGTAIGAPNKAFTLLANEFAKKPADAEWGRQWPLDWSWAYPGATP